MRTISVTVDAAGIPDLDGQVVDDLESLRQRIVQRLQFGRGTWALDATRGTVSVLGHDLTIALAQAVLVDAIREEGSFEVIGVPESAAQLDRETRVLRFSARVQTIYGPMDMSLDV